MKPTVCHSLTPPPLKQSCGEDILASLRELEGALRESAPVERHDHAAASGGLNPECLYYLSAYGTHLALVSFYMRHNCVTEALTYLINKVRGAEERKAELLWSS